MGYSAGFAPAQHIEESEDLQHDADPAFDKLRAEQFQKYERQLDIEIAWLERFIVDAPQGKSIEVNSEKDIEAFILSSKLLRALKICGLWDDLFLSLLFDLQQPDLLRLIIRFKTIENVLDIRERIHLAAEKSGIKIGFFSDSMVAV